MNTSSTIDKPHVRWASDQSGKDTASILFKRQSQRINGGHVVVACCDVEPDKQTTQAPGSVQEATYPPTVKRIPRAQPVSFETSERYIMLKKYEGVVMSRNADFFVARLFENASDYPVIQAEFSFDELSEDDRNLVVEGAPLVWTIGYGYDGSTRVRQSRIYLRRLPKLTAKEINAAEQKAEQLFGEIHWE